MNINLSRQDLLNLVLGTTPNYAVFENHRVKSTGKYIGGFKEEWQWDRSKLELLPEQELYNLYIICRDSWAPNAIDNFERDHHSCPACGKELTFDIHQNTINGLKT